MNNKTKYVKCPNCDTRGIEYRNGEYQCHICHWYGELGLKCDNCGKDFKRLFNNELGKGICGSCRLGNPYKMVSITILDKKDIVVRSIEKEDMVDHYDDLKYILKNCDQSCSDCHFGMKAEDYDGNTIYNCYIRYLERTESD